MKRLLSCFAGAVVGLSLVSGCGAKSEKTDSNSELAAAGYVGSSDVRATYYYGRIYLRSSAEMKDVTFKVGTSTLQSGSFYWSYDSAPVFYSSYISPKKGDTVDITASVKKSGVEKKLYFVFAYGSYGLELKERPAPVDDSQDDQDQDQDNQDQNPGQVNPNMPTGDIDQTFAASNGMKSRYRMFVPADYAKKQRGFLVYLHGDLHLELAGSYFISEMKTLAEKYNLIPIAVYSPNAGERWWTGGASYADVLHQLLSKVKKDYNVNTNKTFFYSMSGGSLFNSGYFIPMYGQYYRGASAFMCGGTSSETSSKSPGTISKNFKMLFYTHPTDFLYSSAMSSMSYYKSMGVSVSYQSPSYGGHCMLNPNTKMDEMLSQWVK